MAALAASGDGLGADFFSELDYGYEAVAAGAVPLLCAGVGPGSEGGERTPERRGEADGNAGAGVVEGLDDVSGQALVAVDIAPRGLPGSEVGGEAVGGCGEGLQQLVRGSLGGDVFFGGDAGFFGVVGCVAANVFAPEDGEGRGDGGYCPAVVPCAQRGDLIGELCFQGIGGGGFVPCLDEGGDWFFEPGEIAVVGGGDQGVEGEVFFALQDAAGVEAARGFGARLDVGRVV